ncbi:class II aldolase/adducin family protein [Cryptosporangium phraense]|uniref:class II aldolase/adducin family protein n=1 Tax=Cryptosporangium phraense TaxID=2593070 RepID=UPI001F10717D|nr:class II aldolase/adducin family protein [Cryptosporangium phraense]
MTDRGAIADVCKRMVADRLVIGTAGNVSARTGDRVAVTPTGVPYLSMEPEDVGIHALDGTPIDAPLRPTSELPLHLAIYAARADVGAVVHTHSTAATSLSCLVPQIPAVHYYLGLFGGSPRVAPYVEYGTDALAAGAVSALEGRTACLLGNHGAVTVGATLAEAYDRAVYLEWVCEVALRVLSSGVIPRLLDGVEMDDATARLATYGQAGGH